MEQKVEVRFVMMEGCDDLEPTRAHFDDAAFDLRSRIDMEMEPHKPHLVPTGLFIELPEHYEAQVRPRSGLALKHAITVLNTPGTVDAGYRGEVGVILFNAGDDNFVVKRGDRIAQMVINKLPIVNFVKVGKLSESLRGTGGFGSTGKE